MDSTDQFYVRTATGLYVPRSVVAPPPVLPATKQESDVLSRQQRRFLDRTGRQNRCGCGQAISRRAGSCSTCATGTKQ